MPATVCAKDVIGVSSAHDVINRWRRDFIGLPETVRIAMDVASIELKPRAGPSNYCASCPSIDLIGERLPTRRMQTCIEYAENSHSLTRAPGRERPVIAAAIDPELAGQSDQQEPVSPLTGSGTAANT
jgi:hypothetical protein